MSAVKPALPSAAVPTAAAVPVAEARVAMILDSARCLLADGRQASRAFSCLVVPRPGDTVLVADAAAGCHVLHILARSDTAAPPVLAALDEGELCLRGRRLRLFAGEDAELVAGRDVRLTAARGSLALDARNLFLNAGESLVQQSRHFIGKALQYLVDARHLLKLHGQDALITAERDIKADAERISMG